MENHLVIYIVGIILGLGSGVALTLTMQEYTLNKKLRKVDSRSLTERTSELM